MKTAIALLLVAGLGASATAQDIAEDKLPQEVRNAFQARFTSAESVEWETKGELYEADFKVGSRDHEVSIDKSGKITRHKEDFPKKQLPKAIQEQLSGEFKAFKLDDADKIEMDGKVFYEVDLDGEAEDREVLFTEDGKVEKNNVD